MATLDYEPPPPPPSWLEWLRRHIYQLVIILLVVTTTVLLVDRVWPSRAQRRPVNQAMVFLDSKGPLLSADGRFASVEVVLTNNRVLQVRGSVGDEQALLDLQNLLQPPASAPIQTMFSVKVSAPTVAATQAVR